MTNFDHTTIIILLRSLRLHNKILRKLKFEFEEKLETLNEPKFQLVLQLRHYVIHCWERDINIDSLYPMMHNTKKDFVNFRKFSLNYATQSSAPDELYINS